MDQHTFEKRAISSKKYTYFQYSVASSLPQNSFFSISNTQEVRDLFPNAASELHSHQFYSIFWFHSGEGTHIVDFDEYNIEKDGAGGILRGLPPLLTKYLSTTFRI